MTQTPEQMQALWRFMQEDIRADKINQRIHRSDLRQKLEKTRDYILAQQTDYKTIEEQVAVAKDRLEMISAAIARCDEQLNAIVQAYNTHAPETVEETEAMLEDLARCRANIASYEKEMRDLHKASNQYMGKVPRIAHSIAQSKQEFDAMKAEYSKETESLKQEEAAQRAKAEACAGEVPPELMEVYHSVKRQIVPPMAQLNGDMCTGCNTSQPNAMLRKIEQGEVVECETCGRILMLRPRANG